jgi:hypothetical protein
MTLALVEAARNIKNAAVLRLFLKLGINTVPSA